MDQHTLPDTTMGRALGDWLHESANELPDDPVLLGRIRAQRTTARPAMRPSLPWRSLRLATASAVAVSVVVVAGLALRTPPPESGFGAAAATATPFPMPPMPLFAGPLEPGRYAFVEDLLPILDRYEVSMDVPAGWQSNDGGWVIDRGNGDPPAGATFEIGNIGEILVDPCDARGPTVDVPWNATLESIAALLTSWGSDTGGRTPDSPTTTESTFGTFDGRPGVEVTVLTPDDVATDTCTGGRYVLWQEALFGNQRWIQGAGESMRLRVIQVGSDLLFLGAGSFAGTPAGVLAEQQAMFDSVRITSRATPAPASPMTGSSLAMLPNVSTDTTPGRYRVNQRWLALGDGYDVSVELLEGWDVLNGTITDSIDARDVAAGLDLWAIGRIYADPCTHDGFTDDKAWSSLDRLAESLTAWSVPHTATSPAVTVPRLDDFDGYPGFEVTASIPTDIDVRDCADGEYRLWRYIDDDVRRAEPGDELLVRVIAVEPASADAATPRADPGRSGLVFVVATTRPGTRPGAREELRAMVDSVEIKSASGGGG